MTASQLLFCLTVKIYLANRQSPYMTGVRHSRTSCHPELRGISIILRDPSQARDDKLKRESLAEFVLHANILFFFP